MSFYCLFQRCTEIVAYTNPVSTLYLHLLQRLCILQIVISNERANNMNEQETEQYVRSQVKNYNDLIIEKVPKLIRNELEIFINICKRNGWTYEVSPDWDGTASLNVETHNSAHQEMQDNDLETDISYYFDWNGYLVATYAGAETQYAAGELDLLTGEDIENIQCAVIELRGLKSILKRHGY